MRLLVHAIDHDQGRHDPARQLSRRNQSGNLAMTSDMIEIWAGMLGLAYLAAASLCFEMFYARKHVPVSHGHARLSPVKVRRPR
jgi:hypothetical protein